MILSHNGLKPHVHPTAWVAPTATICGNVRLGRNVRIAHGARIIAERQPINIGEQTIILENAVVRSTPNQSTKIGLYCLIGPNAHLVGCELEEQIFVATGAAIFHEAYLEKDCEVRVQGTVHLRTHLSEGETVPIGWVAVGNPAQILPPDQHEQIWKIQKPLNFPETAYGLNRELADMQAITAKMADRLGRHAEDEVIPDRPPVISN